MIDAPPLPEQPWVSELRDKIARLLPRLQYRNRKARSAQRRLARLIPLLAEWAQTGNDGPNLCCRIDFAFGVRDGVTGPATRILAQIARIKPLVQADWSDDAKAEQDEKLRRHAEYVGRPSER
jgi:hypothetical protein